MAVGNIALVMVALTIYTRSGLIVLVASGALWVVARAIGPGFP